MIDHKNQYNPQMLAIGLRQLKKSLGTLAVFHGVGQVILLKARRRRKVQI
jgi:hypothetical protein